uniref:Uncharacterized protein n=1 Tax=Cucumis sativus TaxID=3659 RepID=A0A0A0KFI6_CUCSA
MILPYSASDEKKEKVTVKEKDDIWDPEENPSDSHAKKNKLPLCRSAKISHHRHAAPAGFFIAQTNSSCFFSLILSPSDVSCAGSGYV